MNNQKQTLMYSAERLKTNEPKTPIPTHWPIVGTLLFLTGIPAIPAIFLLALVALGPGAVEGISSIIHDAHFDTPLAIFVHGGSGIVFFLTMPFQFSAALRQRFLTWHKVSGRLAVVSGIVMGLSALWMHLVLTPQELGPRFYSLIVMSLAMCISFSIAVWFIVKGKVSAHKSWMIRAIAITLAAVTPLFIDAILVLLFGHLQSIFAAIVQLQHDYGRLFAMALNLLIAQYCIHRSAR